MTKTEIINETVEFYSADTSRRAKKKLKNGTSRCVYFNEITSNMCAFGRCMINPKSYKESISSVLEFADSNNNVDSVLKLEYRGHSLMFWKNIQEFHDTNNYWDNKGLTEEGKLQLNCLLTKYKN